MSDLSSGLAQLRAPFTPEAVRFKIQTNPKQDGQRWKKALIVTFMDSRMAAERLNTACPGDWSDEYEPMYRVGQTSAGVVCRLTVQGVTRSDVGYEQNIDTDMGLKGLYSDAFKRAAVKFGVGAYLYALPKMFADHTELKQFGKSWVIPDQTERKLRGQYAQWLGRAEIIERFGKPIDHGITEDSQGDPETIIAPTVPREIVDEVAAEIGPSGVAGDALKALMVKHGATIGGGVKASLASMTPEGVEAFRSDLVAESAKTKLNGTEVAA